MAECGNCGAIFEFPAYVPVYVPQAQVSGWTGEWVFVSKAGTGSSPAACFLPACPECRKVLPVAHRVKEAKPSG